MGIFEKGGVFFCSPSSSFACQATCCIEDGLLLRDHFPIFSLPFCVRKKYLRMSSANACIESI